MRCSIRAWIIRVFPRYLGCPTHSGDNLIMNHLFFIWSAMRAMTQAYSRHSDQQEQRAVETYLASARSTSELEYRERQWLRAHS